MGTEPEDTPGAVMCPDPCDYGGSRFRLSVDPHAESVGGWLVNHKLGRGPYLEEGLIPRQRGPQRRTDDATVSAGRALRGGLRGGHALGEITDGRPPHRGVQLPD
jgi:hypothetical protein